MGGLIISTGDQIHLLAFRAAASCDDEDERVHVSFSVQTHVCGPGWMDLYVLVYASHRNRLYLATEMGMYGCRVCGVRAREGELQARLKPSFVRAMYALCGGKLKNISMIKAGYGCLGDHVTHY